MTPPECATSADVNNALANWLSTSDGTHADSAPTQTRTLVDTLNTKSDALAALLNDASSGLVALLNGLAGVQTTVNNIEDQTDPSGGGGSGFGGSTSEHAEILAFLQASLRSETPAEHGPGGWNRVSLWDQLMHIMALTRADMNGWLWTTGASPDAGDNWAPAFQYIIDQLRDTINDIPTTDFSLLATAAALQAAQDALDGLVLALPAAVTEINEFTDARALTLEGAITEQLGLAIEDVNNHTDIVGAAISTNIEDAVLAINAHTDGIVSGINAHTDAAAGDINANTDAAETAIIAAINDSEADINAVTVAARNTVTASVTAARTLVIQQVTTTQTAITNAITASQTTVTNAIAATQTAITTAITATQTAITTAITASQTAITAAISPIGLAITAMRTIVDAIDDRVASLTTALTAARAVIDQIWEALQSLLPGARTLTLVHQTTWSGVFRYEQEADIYQVDVTAIPEGRMQEALPSGTWYPKAGWIVPFQDQVYGARQYLEFSTQVVPITGILATGLHIHCKPGTTGSVRAYRYV